MKEIYGDMDKDRQCEKRAKHRYKVGPFIIFMDCDKLKVSKKNPFRGDKK
jgi:hypothetical protein